MAEQTEATKTKSSSSSMYEPCIECKKKRTLCVRVRRPAGGLTDFGHAALSLKEPRSDGTTTTNTYGNWTGTENGTSIRKNYSQDDPANDSRWRPEDVRCKEIDEEQEKKLKEELAKPQSYWATNNNCSSWAGRTWNNVTGDNLNYGQQNWDTYDAPSTLLDSMQSTP